MTIPPPPPYQPSNVYRIGRNWTAIWLGVAATAVVIAAAVMLVVLKPFTDPISGKATLALAGSGTQSGSFPTPSDDPLDSTPTPTTAVGSPAPSSSEDSVPFSSASGHFSATFPAEPTVKTMPLSVSGVQASITIAATDDPIAVVESEILSRSIPSAQADETMAAAIRALTVSGKLTVNSQTATTFRGFAARKASLSASDDTALTVELFFATPKRMYLILGEDGTVFDGLLASFALV